MLFKRHDAQRRISLAARADPGITTKATDWLAQRNAAELVKTGTAPSGQSLGIAHYLGPQAAASVMAAPDNAPVSGFVSADAVKANPELAKMTAGQLRQRYANVPAPEFLAPKQTTAAPGTQPPLAPVQTAGPAAPTGTPPAPDAIQPVPNTPAPTSGPPAPRRPGPETPDAALTFEQYRTRHAWQPTPAEQAAFQVTPDPKALADAQAAKQAAGLALTAARLNPTGDQSTPIQAYNTATDAVASCSSRRRSRP